MREVLEKNCIQCGKKFFKPIWISLKNWNETRKYCSNECQSEFWRGKESRRKGKGLGLVPWNKGRKSDKPAWNKGNGDYAKKLGFGKWMAGKKASLESRRKLSETMKKRVADGKHNFYIDGRTPEVKRIRTSLEYKLWRESVFKRDNYTCQECGVRSGNGKRVVLNADHIKPFSTHPELRFDINNGRTLCVPCHKETDTYMGRIFKKKINDTFRSSSLC